MSLFKRSMTSVAWTTSAHGLRLVVFLARAIVLARLLPIETFGVFAFAMSVLGFSSFVIEFGMGAAYLHRAPETEDEDQAAAAFFSLTMTAALLWAAAAVGLSCWLAEGALRTALLVITFSTVVWQLSRTPRLILTRRVEHRRMAIVQALTFTASTASCLLLAFHGADLWALLIIQIVGSAVTLLGYYAWRPVWIPRLYFSRRTTRYFLGFGSRTALARVLANALDKLDDLWTAFFLGDLALGFYSRAYQFAGYPRMILSQPVSGVTSGAYAELKPDRLTLSKAFFRTNAFLVRGGFLLAGLLFVAAPEFIQLVIGERWMPMLPAFRFLVILALLDPMRASVSNLFLAVGQPGRVVEARFIQLGILLAGLFLLGPRMGITGVGAAVSTTALAGMVLLLSRARNWVDFSAGKLFRVPCIALAVALGVSLGVAALLDLHPIALAALKAGAFTLVYAAVLCLVEPEALRLGSRLARSWRDPDASPPQGPIGRQ